MTPYFSVIVPVYKVEPWLRACVDSILVQSFEDFELILVDDGSPDGCPAICDEYAARDPRVRVIHQANRGLAKARKAGLDIARAEYICFVDSDDMVVPRWLETVRAIMEENGRPDIVLFDHVRDNGPAQFPILAEEGFYDKARMEKEIYPYMLWDRRRRPFGAQLIPAYLVERVCRRQLLLDHYVPDGEPITLFEDIAMAYECMVCAGNMYVCREALYIYRDREQSLLTGYRPQFLREVGVCFGYVRRRLGGRDRAIDEGINAACLRKVLVGVVHQIEHTNGSLAAARSLRQALKDTDVVRALSFAGLPWDMKAYLLLLKWRLYLPAVLLTRHKM